VVVTIVSPGSWPVTLTVTLLETGTRKGEWSLLASSTVKV
jgi:hypothetical protein